MDKEAESELKEMEIFVHDPAQSKKRKCDALIPLFEEAGVLFHSKIGNSGVDYPYAIGKTHVYLLLGKVALETSYFDLKEDIYDQYYSMRKKFKDKMVPLQIKLIRK